MHSSTKAATIKQKIEAYNKANNKVAIGIQRHTTKELNEWLYFYQVMWWKGAQKKYPNKKDGFLAVGSIFAILVTDESKKLARSSSSKLKE